MLAVAFITSVAMSNIGIKHVYVSFAMTVGATAPLFTVICSKVMLAKEFNKWVYISIIPMILGISMAAKGEMNFDTIGFVCCTIGVIFRAIKSVIQQMLLTDPQEKLNPIELLFYMSQPCILITGIWAYTAEGAEVGQDPATYRTQTWVMYLVTCILAVGMNITTFLVTFLTSAVTLQVLGQGKVVMTILLSLVLFRNQISLLGGVGCCTTIGGAMIYNHVKGWPLDS
jgi:drug/metabolite transporter (DMT)-like permease